jgi:hypothetical protein
LAAQDRRAAALRAFKPLRGEVFEAGTGRGRAPRRPGGEFGDGRWRPGRCHKRPSQALHGTRAQAPVGPLPDGLCDAIARVATKVPMAATSNMTIESVPLAVIPTIDPSGLNPTCAGSGWLTATKYSGTVGLALPGFVELAGAMAVD